jgi:hypothetical protein
MINTNAPITTIHEGITVIRDDLLPGGTKSRYAQALFHGYDELVYASPCEGGAQTALAYAAKILDKKLTLFVAKRKNQHERVKLSVELGANIIEVSPGYLVNVQKKAKDYFIEQKYKHNKVINNLHFGISDIIAQKVISDTAKTLPIPDTIWCATGSGVLAKALRHAWPNAKLMVVTVGKKISWWDCGKPQGMFVPNILFNKPCLAILPFPSDPHYDAKAWQLCLDNESGGRLVYFWNVAGSASQQREIILEALKNEYRENNTSQSA